MDNNIDINRLKKDLIDYFGSAMPYNFLAIIDLSKVENCNDYELINIAIRNGFDLNNYINKVLKK